MRAHQTILPAILVLSLLLLPCAEAIAQKSISTFKKHSVGINVSNDVTSQFDNYQLLDNQKRAAKYGYSLALLYQYWPVKWFSVETGAEINSTAYQINDTPPDYYLECLVGNYYGTDEGTYRLNRIGIPLNLKWHYQLKRWDFYALTGLALTTTYSGTYDKPSYDGPRQSEIKIKEGFGLACSAGVGATYQLTQALTISIEPRFRVYDVVDLNRPQFLDGTDNHVMPWAAGLNMGLYYGFGK